MHQWTFVLHLKCKYSSFCFVLSHSAPLPPFHFNTFKINTNLTKCKNNHAMNAYFMNVISVLFTPLWSCCRHRNDNPCWDSVASSQQIWMLNPLAKHHSQSELAMINNPTREIWLAEMEAGDLRECRPYRAAVRLEITHRENMKCSSAVGCVGCFPKTWVGTPNWVFGGLQLNESWTLRACC